MRFKLVVCLVFILMSSCSKNKGFGEAIPIEMNTNYFPLTTDNNWSYRNSYEFLEDHKVFEEHMSVKDSIKEDETISYRFSSNLEAKKKGIGTSLLTNGKLTKVEGKLIFNGDFMFHIPVLDDTLALPLRNLILLDQNIGDDKSLSNHEGTVEDSIDLMANDTLLPISYSYKLKTVSGQKYKSFEVINTEYEDVISTQLELDLSAKVNLPEGYDLEIFVKQDVLKSTFRFAKEIGLISVESELNIDFEDLSEFSLDHLKSDSGVSTQFLKDYSLH